MDFRARLAKGEVILGDGALGTLLMERGLRAGHCPEVFVLEQASVLTDIAREYLEAGAAAISTCTFGATSLRLSVYGLETRGDDINRGAVRAVREAVGERALVSASIGPTAALLRPYGDTHPEQVFATFRQQVRALISEGVDLLCIETMTDVEEAVLAVKAARDISKDVPIIATMTFDPTPRGYFTLMGTSVPVSVTRLKEAGADLVGANCGNGIERMVEIARAFARVQGAPLAIQANAGLPRTEGTRVVYPETPQEFALRVADFVQAGVQFLGGCCGTTPDHIRAMVSALADLTSVQSTSPLAQT